MGNLIIGTFVAVLVVLVLALIYALCGAFFALMWNWLMPSLWAAAPYFTWKMGVAAAWLIGIAQAIFGGFHIIKKA